MFFPYNSNIFFHSLEFQHKSLSGSITPSWYKVVSITRNFTSGKKYKDDEIKDIKHKKITIFNFGLVNLVKKIKLRTNKTRRIAADLSPDRTIITDDIVKNNSMYIFLNFSANNNAKDKGKSFIK